MRFLVFFLSGFFYSFLLYSQDEKVEIVNTDVFEFAKIDSKAVRKLIGNVILKQENTLMYCDSAYHFTHENLVQAYSNVKLVIDDTTQLTGSKLFYDGNTQIAEVFDNVTLTDGKTKLFTNHLVYNRRTKIGEYINQGKIVDGENELLSQRGIYQTDQKLATFQGKVIVNSPDYQIFTEKLTYQTQSKIVYLATSTYLKSKKDSTKAYAENGWVDTEQNNVFLYGNPWYQDSSYTAQADTFYFWDKQDSGKAVCNITIWNQDTTIVLHGEESFWNSKTKEFWVTDNPYVIYFMENDTITMFADTLYSIQDSSKDEKKLVCWHNVQMYGNQLQAISDSLIYDMKDSLIYFYQEPILWADSSQMVGDTIVVWVKNQNADSIAIRNNSFLISQQDSIGFNQIKGKNIDGKFKNKELYSMIVTGGANSIYFAKDDDKYLGMNQGEAAKIRIYFQENKPSRITFIENASATYYPMHEIWYEKNQLEGFYWWKALKPSKYFFKNEKEIY